MHIFKVLAAAVVCVCLTGCSAMSDGMSMAASLSEKPADVYAARQGLISPFVETLDFKF